VSHIDLHRHLSPRWLLRAVQISIGLYWAAPPRLGRARPLARAGLVLLVLAATLLVGGCGRPHGTP
jgi:hypothetical protein